MDFCEKGIVVGDVMSSWGGNKMYLVVVVVCDSLGEGVIGWESVFKGVGMEGIGGVNFLIEFYYF